LKNQADIGTRLVGLIEENGISNYQLAKAIGKSDSTISRIINKGAKPNAETLTLISNYFRINEKWLLTGLGNKLKSDKNASNNASTIALNNLFPAGDYVDNGRNKFIRVEEGNYLMLTPFVQIQNHLHFIDNHSDKNFINTLPVNSYAVTKPLDEFYFSFEVDGDDMHTEAKPSIEEGYIVTAMCLDKEKWYSRFVFKRNKLYVIVHKEAILVREIISYDPETESIEVHAYNEDYKNETIYLKNCLKILVVVGITWRL
jgi:plasmid maintenance system antidote protein VapI